MRIVSNKWIYIFTRMLIVLLTWILAVSNGTSYKSNSLPCFGPPIFCVTSRSTFWKNGGRRRIWFFWDMTWSHVISLVVCLKADLPWEFCWYQWLVHWIFIPQAFDLGFLKSSFITENFKVYTCKTHDEIDEMNN